MGFRANSKILRGLVTFGTPRNSDLSLELAKEAIRKPNFLEEAIKAEIVCDQRYARMNRQLVYVVGLGFIDIIITRGKNERCTQRSKKALFYVGHIIDGNIEQALKDVDLSDLYGFTPFSAERRE